MKFPIIPSIRTFADVQNALQKIREYFTSSSSVGNLNVTQPTTKATLTIRDGKELIVDKTWSLGKAEGNLENRDIDITQALVVVLEGITYEVAVLKRV
jgi:hypothetical protein